MNDILTAFLARLIDSFKAKTPKLYGILALALMAIIFFADKGTMLGLWVLDGQWATAVQYIATVVGILLGSRTTSFLSPPTSPGTLK